MTRHIFILTSIAFLFSCSSIENKNEKSAKKVVKTEINKNVETLGLIYYLADSSLFYTTNISESSHLLKYYLKKFSKLKNHPTVIAAKRLIDNGFLEGCSSPTLGLYFTDLPEFKRKYDIDYTFDSENENEIMELEKFSKQLYQFYLDADLDSFFLAESKVYNKILSEINTTLPDSNYINALEQYYGIQMLDYVIVPSLFVPNYFNFGSIIKTNSGTINYYVLGPAYDINIDTIIDINSGLGFDDKQYVLSLGVHEFSHTFVRFIDKPENVELIESISHFYTPLFAKKMKRIGYVGWEAAFEEYLVRLCEIRIAKLMGNEKLSRELYNEYAIEGDFIYLQPLSEIIIDYENNRNVYEKFEDFFPILIERMANIDIKEYKN